MIQPNIDAIRVWLIIALIALASFGVIQPLNAILAVTVLSYFFVKDAA